MIVMTGKSYLRRGRRSNAWRKCARRISCHLSFAIQQFDKSKMAVIRRRRRAQEGPDDAVSGSRFWRIDFDCARRRVQREGANSGDRTDPHYGSASGFACPGRLARPVPSGAATQGWYSSLGKFAFADPQAIAAGEHGDTTGLAP
jgi:hypothetical protein